MISLADMRPAWRRGPTAPPPIAAQTPGKNHRPRKKPRRSDPASSPPSLSDGRLPQKAFHLQPANRPKTPYPGAVYSDRQKTRKKQTDDGGSGGRLNPSRFLFRLAFLSWPLVPVRRIALFFQDS